MFGSATIGSTDLPVPSPITHVDVYGPAGVDAEPEGHRHVHREATRKGRPEACPANSRAGIGGGEGAYEIAHEIVNEPYTLEFFLADNQPGHVAL